MAGREAVNGPGAVSCLSKRRRGVQGKPRSRPAQPPAAPRAEGGARGEGGRAERPGLLAPTLFRWAAAAAAAQPWPGAPAWVRRASVCREAARGPSGVRSAHVAAEGAQPAGGRGALPGGAGPAQQLRGEPVQGRPARLRGQERYAGGGCGGGGGSRRLSGTAEPPRGGPWGARRLWPARRSPSPAAPGRGAALLPRPRGGRRGASPRSRRATSWCARGAGGRPGGRCGEQRPGGGRERLGRCPAFPGVAGGGAFPRDAWTLLQGAGRRRRLPEEGKPPRPKVSEPGRGRGAPGRTSWSPSWGRGWSVGCCLSEAGARPGPKGLAGGGGWMAVAGGEGLRGGGAAPPGRLVGGCAGLIRPVSRLVPSQPPSPWLLFLLLLRHGALSVHADAGWTEGRFLFYKPEHPIINKADESLGCTAASTFMRKGRPARILGQSQARLLLGPASCWDADKSLALRKRGLARKMRGCLTYS